MRNYLLTLACVVSLSAFAQKQTPYASNLYGDTEWTVVNVEEGSRTWEDYAGSLGNSPNLNYKQYHWDSTHAADDWLISPEIYLEAGKEYVVRFWGQGSNVAEEYSLKMAKAGTVEALSADDAVTIYEFAKDLKSTGSRDNSAHKNSDVVSISESGNYYFGFHVYSPTDKYYVRVNSFAIYENIFSPAAPTDLAVTVGLDYAISASLSWKLPTVDNEGVALAEDAVFNSVEVYRDNELIATLAGDATSFEDSESLGLTAGKHVYGVRVQVNNSFGAQATVTSKYIGHHTAETLPWISDFANMTADDAADMYTVYKGENSTSPNYWTYSVSSTYGNRWMFYPSSSNCADDWLITPEINVPKAGVYRIVVNMSYASFSTSLDICLGQGTNVANYKTLKNYTSIPYTAADYEIITEISEPGIYSLAAHCNVPSASSSIHYINKFSMEEWKITPAAISDLALSAEGENNSQINLSWTNPSKNNIGGDVTELSKIEIYRDDALLKTIEEEIVPGEAMSYSDQPEGSGIFKYKVIPYIGEYAAEGTPMEVSSPWVGDPTQPLPYQKSSFSATDAGLFIIKDVNEDGNAWAYSASNSRFEFPKPSNYHTNNDILMTPPFDMEPGYYSVVAEVGGGSSSCKLSFALVPYDTEDPASDMTSSAPTMKLNGYTSTASAQTLYLKAENEGKYRLAIRYSDYSSTSDKAVLLGSLKISSIPLIPSIAKDLSVTAGDDYALTALVKWTNPPTSNITDVVPEITEAVIYRDDVEIGRVTEGLRAGFSSEFLDENVPNAGYYTYKVEIYGPAGKSSSAAASIVSPWIGGGKELPYSAGTNADNDFNNGDWTVFNVNGDSNTTRGEITWEVYSGYACITTTSKVGDDWFISPRLNFVDGQRYEVSVSTYAVLGSSDCTRAIDVAFGTGVDPKLMTVTLGTLYTETGKSKSDAQVDVFVLDAVEEEPAAADEEGEEEGEDAGEEAPAQSIIVPAGVGTIGFHVNTMNVCGICKVDISHKGATLVKDIENGAAISLVAGNLDFGSSAKRVVIADLQGRVMFSAANIDRVDTSKLAKGVYVVSAIVNGKAMSFKFVK